MTSKDLQDYFEEAVKPIVLQSYKLDPDVCKLVQWIAISSLLRRYADDEEKCLIDLFTHGVEASAEIYTIPAIIAKDAASMERNHNQLNSIINNLNLKNDGNEDQNEDK